MWFEIAIEDGRVVLRMDAAMARLTAAGLEIVSPENDDEEHEDAMEDAEWFAEVVATNLQSLAGEVR